VLINDDDDDYMQDASMLECDRLWSGASKEPTENSDHVRHHRHFRSMQTGCQVTCLSVITHSHVH